jgi:hypothetical protein
VKDASLNLGGLVRCPDDPDYRGGNTTGMACEKSAEAIVGRQLGEAIEALQGRKVE